MKKLSMCFTAILLLLSACEKDCKINYPKNLKPIDWENYNDVYTVYWNYKSDCQEIRKDENKDIMVSGWIHNFNGFSRLDFELGDTPDENHTPCILITTSVGDVPYEGLEVILKLDTCDLSKKCFIKGKLLFYQPFSDGMSYPAIYFNDANNIYFE